MARLKNISTDALLYGTGLALACSLAWLGYLAVATPDIRAQQDWATGPTGMIWFVPAAYLAAWQTMVFRNLALAVLGAVLLAALNFAIFHFVWIVGLFSFGLLVPPASFAAICVVTTAVARIQRFDGDGPRGPLIDKLHGLGAALFVVGVLVGLVKIGGPPVWDGPSWPGIAAYIACFLCALTPHAALTWARLRGTPRPIVVLARVAGLLLAAWALPAALLAVEARARTPLLWPLETVSIIASRKADIDLFSSVKVQQPGFHAGEKLLVNLGEHRRDVQVTVPPGWLGTNARYPGKRFTERVGLWLVPDPRMERQTPSPTTKITIRGQPSLNTALPLEARPRLKHPRLWREFGCVADDKAPVGLVICRQIAYETGDRPHPPLIARLPDASLRYRIMLDEWGFGVERTYYLAGPSAWAECVPGRDCDFWFPAGERNAVWVTLPEAEVHRWQEARDEADAVARAAAGFGLASRPTLEQPDGEVLPLARR